MYKIIKYIKIKYKIKILWLFSFSGSASVYLPQFYSSADSVALWLFTPLDWLLQASSLVSSASGSQAYRRAEAGAGRTVRWRECPLPLNLVEKTGMQDRKGRNVWGKHERVPSSGSTQFRWHAGQRFKSHIWSVTKCKVWNVSIGKFVKWIFLQVLKMKEL